VNFTLSSRSDEPRGGQLPDVRVAAEAGRREVAPRCADGRGPRADLAMGGEVIQTPLSIFYSGSPYKIYLAVGRRPTCTAAGRESFSGVGGCASERGSEGARMHERKVRWLTVERSMGWKPSLVSAGLPGLSTKGAENSGSATSPSVSLRERGVRLAQTIQVGPCIPVGIRSSQAEVLPTSELPRQSVV
jgi:hypothetical protein